MQIFIPTRGRVERQASWDNLPSYLKRFTTLICPEEEVEAHKARGRNVRGRPSYVKGISASRQYIMESCPEDRFIMIDDDMRFYVRNDPSAWNLRQASEQDTLKLFQRMWDMIATSAEDPLLGTETWAAVGLTTRQNNNMKYPDTVQCNTKINGVMGFNRKFIELTGARFDDVQIQEDYHIVLSLLERGFPVGSIVDAAWNQVGSTGAPGGCSTYRTKELQDEGSKRLAELHPFVKVVEKEYAEAAGNLGNKRLDVVVYWKKAFASGVAKYGKKE